MKKLGLKIISLLLVTTFILSGCGKNKSETGTSSDNGKMKVYTTFYPMYDFSKKIGGDKVDVVNLIPAGTEPHDWEPSPQDLVEISKAKILVYNGAGMENWIGKVAKSEDNKNLMLVEASKGIKLLKVADEEKNSSVKNKNEEHGHGGYDPHVWLSPKNAIVELTNIKNAFVKADPKNSAYYEENYKKTKSAFEKLDNEFREKLSKTKKKEIIVAHEAFGYLCNEYGIKQVGIEGLSPDSEPDAAKMAEIAAFAKKNHIKYIFFEDLVSPKVAKTIATEVGAKTEVLNPLEGLTEAQMKAGDDYISVMNNNLKNLLKALN